MKKLLVFGDDVGFCSVYDEEIENYLKRILIRHRSLINEDYLVFNCGPDGEYEIDMTAEKALEFFQHSIEFTEVHEKAIKDFKIDSFYCDFVNSLIYQLYWILKEEPQEHYYKEFGMFVEQYGYQVI